jgi:hypothetical protein
MKNEKKEKELIVTLRVYHPTIRKDKDDNPYYENHPVKIEGYGRLAWKTFMKSAKIQYKKVLVEKVHEETIWLEDGKDRKGKPIKIRKTKYDLIETPQEIIDAVAEAMQKVSEKLTPDQQKIVDLEAKSKLQEEQIAELMASNNGNTTTDTDTDTSGNDSTDVDKELAAWREKYEKVIGKKAHPMSKASTLEKKIEEHLAKQ